MRLADHLRDRVDGAQRVGDVHHRDQLGARRSSFFHSSKIQTRRRHCTGAATVFAPASCQGTMLE